MYTHPKAICIYIYIDMYVFIHLKRQFKAHTMTSATIVIILSESLSTECLGPSDLALYFR